jgi:hypothetical protein
MGWLPIDVKAEVEGANGWCAVQKTNPHNSVRSCFLCSKQPTCDESDWKWIPPWNRMLLEKIIVAHLVMKFVVF